MKNFFKFIVARRLTRTPIGLAALVLGWFLGRRRKKRREQQEAARR